MLTPLLAGLFALAGVTLGVLFEPVKARWPPGYGYAKTEHCAQLVEAANTTRAAILWLFRTIRATTPPPTVSTIIEAEQRYWAARNELKKAVLLIRLVGPADLITGAVAISDSDLALRALWFDQEHSARLSHSADLSQALQANTRTLEDFTEVARRLSMSP